MQLFFGTLNALSLRDHKQAPSNDAPGKLVLLCAGLAAEGLDMVALQETRLPPGVVSSGDFIVVSSGCDSNFNFGCSLCLRNVVRLGSSVRFELDHIRVLAASPTYLCVAVTSPLLVADIVSFHAPHAQHTDEFIQSWWKTLDSVLRGVKRQHAHLFFLGDANGRVSATEYGNIGTHGASTPDVPGLEFTKVLSNFDLWLPSTFSAYTSGDTWTWQHSSGTRHRLDYIAIPSSMRCSSVSCRVDHDFDTLSAHIDHALVTLSLVCDPIAPKPLPERRVHQFDRGALCQEDVRSLISDQMRAVALPAWHVDPDTHYAMLVSFLIATLKNLF